MAESNPNERRAARAAVVAANRLSNDIHMLPPFPGSRVQWKHNGNVWMRVGDDAWTSLGVDAEHEASPDAELWSSAHVASLPYMIVDWLMERDDAASEGED